MKHRPRTELPERLKLIVESVIPIGLLAKLASNDLIEYARKAGNRILLAGRICAYGRSCAVAIS